MKFKQGSGKKSDRELQFDEIFRDNYKNLFLYAKKFISDSEVVADLLQDLFEKLWLKIDTIDKIQNIQSYLTSSIRNECLNYIRHQKVENTFYQEEINNIKIELEYFSGEKSIIEDQRFEKLNKIIADLPEIYKEVMVLSRYKNYSNKEIARELGIPVRTVETRLFRGLKKIRKEL